MTARTGWGRPVTRRRGEGRPVDLAAMTEQPFTTLRVTDANAVEIETNRAHPMVKFGGDLLDNALVVLTDLPREPVAPGYQWTIVRNVPLGQNLGRVDVSRCTVTRPPWASACGSRRLDFASGVRRPNSTSNVTMARATHRNARHDRAPHSTKAGSAGAIDHLGRPQ
jgi:hypothetical protein